MANASDKEWVESDVIQAGDKVLTHIDDQKEEAMIDNTKANEYKTEVMKAKKVMGNALWELMLIIMEGDKNEQPATVLENSLNTKYLWKQGLSDNHLKCKQKRKLLCSATKIGEEHSWQVETATYICNLIMCELDCIEDITTKFLQFLQQAKDVAKGIIWN